MNPFKLWRGTLGVLPLVALGVPASAQTAKPRPAEKPTAKSTPAPAATAKKLPLRQVITARPATVPAATWAKIIALKPGMTRADLLQVFEPEGGVSIPTRRTYILRGGMRGGPNVQITATFAPDTSLFDWQDALGLPIIAAPPKGDSIERPGDVITSLSPLFRGPVTVD